MEGDIIKIFQASQRMSFIYKVIKDNKLINLPFQTEKYGNPLPKCNLLLSLKRLTLLILPNTHAH